MKWLSRKEEFVLLAINSLGDDAYGVTIREYLTRMTGRRWSIGSTYDVLDRLARKRCIGATISPPVPERGGRSKRLYHITEKGVRELEQTRRLHRIMWPRLLKPACKPGNS